MTEPEKPVMTVGPCFRFQSLTGAPACKLPEGSPDWVLITFSGSMVILLPSFCLVIVDFELSYSVAVRSVLQSWAFFSSLSSQNQGNQNIFVYISDAAYLNSTMDLS